METETLSEELKVSPKRTPPATTFEGEYDLYFELGIAVVRWFWYRYEHFVPFYPLEDMKSLESSIYYACRGMVSDTVRNSSARGKDKIINRIWNLVGRNIVSRELEQFIEVNRNLVAEMELTNVRTR